MPDAFDFKFLKNLVRRRVDHGDIEHIVEDSINEAVQDIISRSSFRFMSSIATLATVASQETYTPPTGTDTIHAIWDTTNAVPITLLEEHAYLRQFGPVTTPQEGNPQFATLIEGDNKIHFSPVPSAIVNLELLITLQHDLLLDEADTFKIPQKYMSVIVNGAVMRVKGFQDRSNSKESNNYEAGIERMIAKDGRLKGVFHGMRDQRGQIGSRGPLWESGGFVYGS